MLRRKFPTALTVLMIVIIIAAIATWLLPAGKYDTLTYENKSFIIHTSDSTIKLPFTQKTLDSLHILIAPEKFETGSIRKPVSVPGTYRRLPSNKQGVIDIIQAPIKGIYDTIDIILFVLIIGGFISVFQHSGAMEQGLIYLSYRMKGKERWLIVILTFLFSFGGSSYGMAEEAFAFYPVMVPLFLAAGYDLIVPVAVLFGGTQLGTLSSFSNPFSTIIASNAAGVNWIDGIYGRILMFVISTAIMIFYIERYGRKTKKNPAASLVYKYDGNIKSPFESLSSNQQPVKPGIRNRLLLLLFLLTFFVMITGVVFFDWWLTEMSALFLASSLIIAIFLRMKEKIFVEKFIKGAEGLLMVAFIIGVARGVTVILNNGHVSDTIVYYSSQAIRHLSPSVFIIILLLLYMVFTLFIASTSGMAVVTMPIMGSLAIMAGVPGQEIVNAYLFGMGIMGFISPTGLILPSLALVNVSFKAWLRFVYPLMIILFIVCTLFLIIGISLK